MPIAIPRLRRWFALAAVLAVVIVAGFYLYARWRISRVSRVAQLIKKPLSQQGLEITQSAEGFSVSKSEQGRTIFTARASRAIRFKEGERAELHNVSITVYGRDSSRFDQITGETFEYDPRSGDISATGPVQIDLEANPEGILNPDQAPPRELKNPIHIRTSGLVFNQKTGNAHTHDKLMFDIATASGWATGATYDSKTGQLVLEKEIRINTTSPSAADLTAAHGLITKEPRRVLLDRVHLVRSTQQVDTDLATLFLNQENRIERVLAEGNVEVRTKGKTQLALSAGKADLHLVGERIHLQEAVVSENVQVKTTGGQNSEGSAGRVIFDFSGGNLLTKARAEGDVKLVQKPATQSKPGSNPQQTEITASAIDFLSDNGRHLSTAITSGPAHIRLLSADGGSGEETQITSGQFEARFDEDNHLRSLHGAPDARIVSKTPGQPDRVSTSQTLDITLRAQGGMDSITQDGYLHYRDGDREAWAEHGRYSAADRLLTLTGSPRVVQQGLTTTADKLRFNRTTGEFFADGNVKTTYSELKAQPEGALLASSEPIHVTAQKMQARRDSATAHYSGETRLWQGSNVVQAESADFDRDRRFISSEGTPARPVTTVLVQTGKDGKPNLVTITSRRLTYADAERKAHFEGSVLMKSADITVGAKTLDAFLARSGQSTGNQSVANTGRLERALAQGGVVVQQPGRQAAADQLVYDVSDDKFTLTGGSPCIFDAERGKITGDSLTFFRRDDRVLVEGKESSPTVTRTRVAR